MICDKLVLRGNPKETSRQKRKDLPKKMEFKHLFRVGTFLFAAIFSFVVLLAKISLADLYQSIENQKYSKYFSQYGELCRTNNQNDVFAVIASFLRMHHKTVLTSLLVALGGVIKLLILFVLIYKKHSCMEPLSSCLKVMMVCTTMLLVDPIMANIYCAYLVYRNHANVDDDIAKYVIAVDGSQESDDFLLQTQNSITCYVSWLVGWIFR